MNFDEILDHSNALVDAGHGRVSKQSDMWSCYNLDWDEKAFAGAPHWVMRTTDPQPADSIGWLTDILSVSEPGIDIVIPDDALVSATGADVLREYLNKLIDFLKQVKRQQSDGEKLAENLEGIARFVLHQNDERRAQSMVRELLIHGFVSDQIAIKCADLRLTKLWQGEDPDLEGKSPFVFIPVDPRNVFTEWDNFGISAALHREVRQLRQVRAMYGNKADLSRSDELKDPNGLVIFAEYWTRQEHAAWIEKTVRDKDDFDPEGKLLHYAMIQKPKENPLGFIPIIVRTCRGTREDIHPILYNGWKSKIFQRASLMLTAQFTEAFKHAIGQYVRTRTNQATPPMRLDFTQPHVYDLEGDQDLKPLLTPQSSELLKALALARTIQDTTTVSKVIAGQEPGGATAAAAINLLVHGAKLALTPVQMAIQDAYAQVVQMMFQYVRAYDRITDGEGNVEMWTDGGTQKIYPSQLPKWLRVNVTLKADLPQDKISLVSMAAQMASARSVDGRPLFSRKTIQSLVIDDLNDEENQIDSDMAGKIAEQLNARQAPGPPSGTMPVPVEQNPAARTGGPEELARAMELAGQRPQ